MKGQPLVVWALLLVSWGLVRAELLLVESRSNKTPPSPAAANAEAKIPPSILIDPTTNAAPNLAPSIRPMGSKVHAFTQSEAKALGRTVFSVSYVEEPSAANVQPIPSEAEANGPLPASPQAIPAPLPVRSNHRLTGDLWIYSRSISGPLPGPILGGSQGGGRLKYRLTSKPLHPSLFASLRFAKPLRGEGLEISPGLSIAAGQKLLVELIVERRVRPEKRNKDQWALLAATGLPATELRKGLTVEAYAQAGLVGIKETIPFAQLGVGVHQSVTNKNKMKIKAGAGLWADYQKSTGRVDLGPEVIAVVNAGEHPVRLSAQWRFKVTGDAQPGSGPSLSIATSF